MKSQKLEELCEILHSYPADWDRMVEEFKSRKIYAKRKMIFSDYVGAFGEIHLDLALEDIADKYPEMMIDFEPFNNAVLAQSRYQYFFNDRGRLVVKHGDDVVSEYDQLITVLDLPVVFEVKIGKEYYGEFRVDISNGRLRKRGGKGALNAMRPNIYGRKLAPIVDAFNVSDVGYVLIASADVYNTLKETKMAKDFEEQRGFFLPLYTERKQFVGKVEQAVSENGFEVLQRGIKERED